MEYTSRTLASVLAFPFFLTTRNQEVNPSVYDIIMAIVLVGAALYGWMRGMAWQIASLASIFLSAAARGAF